MNENNAQNNLLLTSFLMMMSITVALIMIGAPIWVISIVSAIFMIGFLIPYLNLFILYLYHIVARPGLYIWAMIEAVQGKQDVIAIIFYVLLGLQAIFIIKNFFSYCIHLIALLFGE